MRLGRRIFWIRGPREWFRKPPEDPQPPRTSKYAVRRGIMQRVLVRELASALKSEANLPHGGLAAWAQGLPAVPPPHFEESASRMLAVFEEPKSGLFRRKLPWHSMLRGGSPESHGRLADGSFPEGRNRAAADRRKIAERYVAGVVAWCERALEAGDEIELQRIVEMALSDATVGYAFGSCEEEIPIDDLCGESLRARLDRIAERLIGLPGLEWWSEGFDPAAYTWHAEVPASWPIRSEGAGVAGVDGAPDGKAAEASVSDDPSAGTSAEPSAGASTDTSAGAWGSRTPTISGAAWFPSSEMKWRVLHSYRDLPASRFDPERQEGSVVDGRTCTEQWFGDDAGDCDVARLDRGDLAGTDGSRIASIHGPEDWMRLVARFPARLTPDVKAEWQGDAEGQMFTVDWQTARREIDGVYVSVAGALRSVFAPLALKDVLNLEGSAGADSAALEGNPALDDSADLGDFATLKGSETVRNKENGEAGESHGCDPQTPLTMMTGWTPGSILWLNRPGVS